MNTTAEMPNRENAEEKYLPVLTEMKNGKFVRQSKRYFDARENQWIDEMFPEGFYYDSKNELIHYIDCPKMKRWDSDGGPVNDTDVKHTRTPLARSNKQGEMVLAIASHNLTSWNNKTKYASIYNYYYLGDGDSAGKILMNSGRWDLVDKDGRIMGASDQVDKDDLGRGDLVITSENEIRIIRHPIQEEEPEKSKYWNDPTTYKRRRNPPVKTETWFAESEEPLSFAYHNGSAFLPLLKTLNRAKMEDNSVVLPRHLAYEAMRPEGSGNIQENGFYNWKVKEPVAYAWVLDKKKLMKNIKERWSK